MTPIGSISWSSETYCSCNEDIAAFSVAKFDDSYKLGAVFVSMLSALSSERCYIFRFEAFTTFFFFLA